MADNTVLNSGSGGDTIASDDIAGVKYQRVKPSLGADGTATDAVPVSAGLDTTGAAVQAVGIVGQFDDVSTAAVTENQFAPVRISTRRALLVEGVASGTAIPVSLSSIAVTNAGTFAIQDSEKLVDNAAFTDGTTKVQPVGFIYDEVAGTALTENDIAAPRINANRATIAAIEDGSTRGRYATVTASNALKVDASAVAVPVTDNSGSLTVDGTITASNTAGDVAHDGADSGNPVKVGGKAVNAEPSAVANGDRANLITDLVGKLITLPYSNPENMLIGTITTAMTGTSDTAVSGMGAPGAGLRNYITSVIVSNTHATVGTDVVLKDGNGGTVIGTFPAAAVNGGCAIALPTPIRQPTTNTALYAANITTGASVKVTCYGYKGA